MPGEPRFGRQILEAGACRTPVERSRRRVITSQDCQHSVLTFTFRFLADRRVPRYPHLLRALRPGKWPLLISRRRSMSVATGRSDIQRAALLRRILSTRLVTATRVIVGGHVVRIQGGPSWPRVEADPFAFRGEPLIIGPSRFPSTSSLVRNHSRSARNRIIALWKRLSRRAYGVPKCPAAAEAGRCRLSPKRRIGACRQLSPVTDVEETLRFRRRMPVIPLSNTMWRARQVEIVVIPNILSLMRQRTLKALGMADGALRHSYSYELGRQHQLYARCRKGEGPHERSRPRKIVLPVRHGLIQPNPPRCACGSLAFDRRRHDASCAVDRERRPLVLGAKWAHVGDLRSVTSPQHETCPCRG